MKLTLFRSKKTNSKFPYSPYDEESNNVFDFISIETNIEKAMEYISSEFILNRNYNIPTLTKLSRTKRDLEKYLEERLGFVILDLDNITSQYKLNKIIEYLKSKDYYFSLAPSRSYDGVNIFNQKGILIADGYNNKASALCILSEIKKDLFEYCKVDISSLNEGAFQAPTYKDEITIIHKGNYIPTYEVLQPKPITKNVNVDNSSKVLDICLEYYRLSGFVIESTKDNIISFSHPSEKTKKGYFLFTNNPFNMKHFNPDKQFSIFNEVKDRKAVQDYLEEINNIKRKEVLGGLGTSKYQLNIDERYIKITPELTDMVDKWYNECGILKIKSAMGTGKSSVINLIIKKAHQEYKPVLIITNRISVANDFKNKYNIKLYSDGDYNIGDSLIVQLESLHKYSLKYFDVVILDEFMSLMLHSRNSLSDYSNLNKVKLQYSLTSKRCVIADAFLYGAEDMFKISNPVFCINNSYRENIKINSYDDINTFIHNVIKFSKSEKRYNRKVTVSCSSKLISKVLYRLCEENNLKTILLNSDSSDEDKVLIFKEFEKENHDSWNVFIYTPTLTVGVSNLNNIKHHFHYDESNSMDVISSIQMIRRSRKAENIHYLLVERKRYLQTSLKHLNDEIISNISKYYIKNKNSLLIDIDENGDPKLSTTGNFINIVEIIYNILESNHKHSFEILLSHQIKNKPILKKKQTTKININKYKEIIKNEEHNALLSALEKLDEINYSQDVIDDFRNRTHLITDEDKLLKLMSEIKPHLKHNISDDDLKKIINREIKTKFNYIGKLKKLNLFLTKNEYEIKGILNHIISENITNKSQIEFFNYLLSIKSKKIQLKNRYSINEIKKIDKYINYKSFKSFIQKIGYRKTGSIYSITQKMIDDSKLVK